MRNDYKMPKYTNLKEEKKLMKNNLLKFTNIVLLITMIAIILVSGSFAKYTSTASGTSATVVANWSFNVNDKNITAEETFEFNLFDTANIKDSDGENEETDVATGLIAPGTSGSFEFKVQNTSEVTAQYAIDFTVTNENDIPIEYSTDGTTWTKELADIVVSEDTILAIGSGEKSIIVQWRWGFSGDDSVDTNLATLETAPTITVEATITATQLNNGANSGEAIMLNGDGQTFHTMAPTALSFRSSANIGDFQEVQINGETIDPSNYTMTEGSTIINLSIDYLKTLAEDDYSISIVSKTGSPSAGFSVIEPDVNSHGFYYNQPYSAFLGNEYGRVIVLIHEDNTLDINFIYYDVVETCQYTYSDNAIVFKSEVFGDVEATISPSGEIDAGGTLLSLNDSVAADEDYMYLYDDSLNGYVVRPLDKTKASYGPIRTGVNNFDTVMIQQIAFYSLNEDEGNTSMVVTPEIPNTVKIISNGAFTGCCNLTRAVIPASVTTIENSVFSHCTSLVNVVFEENSQLTTLGWGAFQYCTSLESIVIPNGVTSIGAFSSCTALANVNIPDSVTRIDSGAFQNCTSLTSIVIPKGVTHIGEGAFANCALLNSIIFEGTVEQWNAISFAEYDGARLWNQNVPATEVVCSDGTVTL